MKEVNLEGRSFLLQGTYTFLNLYNEESCLLYTSDAADE